VMLKYLALSILIPNSTSLYSMENNPLILCKKNPQKHVSIETIGANINRFKTWVNCSYFHSDPMLEADSDVFIEHCYFHQSYPENFTCNLKFLDKNPTELNTCKNLRKHGYSCLGALLMGYPISQEECKEHKQKQCACITMLKVRDFIPTEEDKKVVQLRLYNSINKKHKTTLTLLLSNNQYNNLAVLPHEVRQHIMRYLISSKKTAY